MAVLDESRDMLRNSLEEFKREQNEYRQQLEDITKNKEAAMKRRKGFFKKNFYHIKIDRFFSYRKCDTTFYIYATKT